jgi:hypothetical protein
MSDLFEFTLPALANPVNIHTIVRVEPKVFYETYLHTSNCPVEDEPKPELPNSQPDFSNFKNLESLGANLTVFPNPTNGSLFADLSDWQGEQIQIQIFESRGQRVQHLTLTADAAPQEITLPEDLPNGLYFLEVLRENGEKQAARFVLQQ